MTTRIAFLPLLLLYAVASGCTAGPEKRRAEYHTRIIANPQIGMTYNDSYRAAALIDPHKPIGEFEAYVLASAYFSAYISGCGGAELPKDRGDAWVAESVEGYGGAPGPRVIVAKRGGVTYSPGRPKVTDPRTYLKFVQKITVI